MAKPKINGMHPGRAELMASVSQSNDYLALQGFKVEAGIVFACNGAGLQNMLVAGQQWLEAHVDLVNRLNVFPVPDGDTGTNMYLTMQSAVQAVADSTDHQVGAIASAAARGALMGARGNSGVILAEFLQGLAAGLRGKDTFTAQEWVEAAQAGVERAYQSVVEPVEGTILTVVRAVVSAAQVKASESNDLVSLFASVVEAARVAQASTPDLLPALKEAGVVDSGGQGLLYILEGGLRFMCRQPVDEASAEKLVSRLQFAPAIPDKPYGYDVQFIIKGQALNPGTIRQQINQMGSSVVVVGDSQLVKIHLHTDDPGRPLSYGASLGPVSDVVVENMQLQAEAFMARQHAGQIAQSGAGAGAAVPVAVVAGRGLGDIFTSLGAAQLVSGGAALNPSTQTLLDAIEQVDGHSVLLLPNHKNIIPAARQAARQSTKQVEVIPAQTVPQGIAALLAFNSQLDLPTNSQRMRTALAEIKTIQLTQAVRPSRVNGFQVGLNDVLGLVDDNLVSVGQNFKQVALSCVASVIDDERHELVTIYVGQHGQPAQGNELAAALGRHYPGIDVEIHDGGQPHYHYIISLE